MKGKQIHMQGGAGKSLSTEIVDMMQRFKGKSLKEALTEYLPIYKDRIKYERDPKKLRHMRIKFEELKKLQRTLNS